MFLAQMPAPQMPDLPEGLSLDTVRGPVEIPLLEPWHWSLIGIITLILVGLFIWFILFLTKKYSSKTLTPKYEKIAHDSLDRAANELEIDDDQFAVDSSLAIRHYLETGWNLTVIGRTTEEFLHDTQKNDQLLEDEQLLLGQFLKQCDRIKFARQPLTTANRNELTEIAKNLVSTLHRRKIELEKGAASK